MKEPCRLYPEFREKFLTSFDAPRDHEAFLAFLKRRRSNIWYFVSNQDSTLVRLFPDAEYGDRIGPFEPVMNSRTKFLRTTFGFTITTNP